MATADRPVPTTIVKHSLVVAGHRTSISLEEAFWQALKATAAQRGLSIAALVAEIDAGRGAANLSSAIRVHLLQDAEARDPFSRKRAQAGEGARPAGSPTSSVPRRP